MSNVGDIFVKRIIVFFTAAMNPQNCSEWRGCLRFEEDKSDSPQPLLRRINSSLLEINMGIDDDVDDDDDDGDDGGDDGDGDDDLLFVL